MDGPPDPAEKRYLAESLPSDDPPVQPAPTRPPRPAAPRPAKRDFAAEEEAGRRLTNAHIQLRRGLTAEAEASVRAILAEHPQDAGAFELLGDIQAARDDWEAAGASYQSALHYETGRASAEAKFGKVTMRRAERQRQETLGVAYAATETAMVRRDNGARGAWPVVLGSALCPGLGQVVQGQTLKGVILIGIFLLGLGLLAGLSHGASGRSFFGPVFWIVNAVLTADWIYAVADAAQANSRGKG